MGFIEQIAPLIKAEGKKRGYKIISTAIAQAILESGNNTSSLSKNYHNYFGMKCGSSWKGKSVNLKTKEEYKAGQLTTINDNFRVYDSMEDGVKGYYDFIDRTRYENLKSATTYKDYAEKIKADGWATDSSYVTKLIKLVEQHNLTQYDKRDNMRDISQLHPKLQEIIPKLIEKASEKGITIHITECLRTVAEQDELYAQGRTKPGKVITNARGSNFSSQHQWGVAFDIVVVINGKADWTESNYDKVGDIGKALGLGWGGDWISIKDRPHFYMKDWGSTTSTLKSMYGTPDSFMKTWGGTTAPTAPSASSLDYNHDVFLSAIEKILGAKGDLNKTITLSAKTNNKHKAVLPIQKYLNSIGCDCGKADGIFGKKTTAGVKEFQRTVVRATAKNQDGIISAKKATWKALLKV